MKSVFQKRKECFICKSPKNIHCHHIFEGTANRRKSEQYGFKIYLCGPHHNLSNEGIHFNKELEIKIKRMAQEYFEEHIGSRDYFIQEFGKSIL